MAVQAHLRYARQQAVEEATDAWWTGRRSGKRRHCGRACERCKERGKVLGSDASRCALRSILHWSPCTGGIGFTVTGARVCGYGRCRWGAGRRLLRPVVLRGVDDPSTSEDPEFHASGGISGVLSERWEVVPEGQSRTRDVQALAARLKRRLGDEAYRAPGSAST